MDIPYCVGVAHTKYVEKKPFACKPVFVLHEATTLMALG